MLDKQALLLIALSTLLIHLTVQILLKFVLLLLARVLYLPKTKIYC